MSDSPMYFNAAGTFVREQFMPVLVPLLEHLPPEGRDAFYTGLLFSLSACLSANSDPDTLRKALSNVQRAVNDPATGLDAQHVIHQANKAQRAPRTKQ